MGQLIVQAYRIRIVSNEHCAGGKSRRHLFLWRLLGKFVLSAIWQDLSLMLNLDSSTTDQITIGRSPSSFLILFHGIHFATSIGLSERVIVVICTCMWFGV